MVIAGAGIIGLSTALALRDAGFRVTVAESGRAMEGSSWAAAGMLAVEDPENAPALLPLSRLSRSLYPEFLARVERLSGLTVPLRSSYTLQGAYGGTYRGTLHARNQGSGARTVELPGLRTDRYAFTLLEEASLDPRDLCAALPRAAVAAGVALREHAAVDSVMRRDGHLTVRLADGDVLAADHFVLAAGAWSGSIPLPDEPTLPVAPRKGQMIELTLDSPTLPVVIRTPELYLVPRGNGRIVIGATVEDAGFDRAIDEAAGERLWAQAAALWPPVLRGRITARWTGLRPGLHQSLHDALPAIGPLGKGMWAATAHFRNGILLAPGTGQLIRELLRGQAPSVPLEGFAPARLQQRQSSAANACRA